MSEERGTVASPGRRQYDRLIPLAIVVLFILNAGIGALTLNNTAARVDGERTERIDQTCMVFERQQLADVQKLRRTYEYLAALPPADLAEPINRAILAQLVDVEREARADDAPPYCDEQGFGLPEPDPEVPERPEGLSR
jgi:hypothetical protein